MKNNKGFTLVELLAIIVILALIILVAAPSMTKQIKKKEDTEQTVLNEKIYNASRMYAAKYYASEIVSTATSSPTFSFTLQDLEDDGLLDLKGKCDGYTTKTIEYIKEIYNHAVNKRVEHKHGKYTYNFDKIVSSNCVSDYIGNYKIENDGTKEIITYKP